MCRWWPWYMTCLVNLNTVLSSSFLLTGIFQALHPSKDLSLPLYLLVIFHTRVWHLNNVFSHSKHIRFMFWSTRVEKIGNFISISRTTQMKEKEKNKKKERFPWMSLRMKKVLSTDLPLQMYCRPLIQVPWNPRAMLMSLTVLKSSIFVQVALSSHFTLVYVLSQLKLNCFVIFLVDDDRFFVFHRNIITTTRIGREKCMCQRMMDAFLQQSSILQWSFSRTKEAQEGRRKGRSLAIMYSRSIMFSKCVCVYINYYSWAQVREMISFWGVSCFPLFSLRWVHVHIHIVVYILRECVWTKEKNEIKHPRTSSEATPPPFSSLVQSIFSLMLVHPLVSYVLCSVCGLSCLLVLFVYSSMAVYKDKRLLMKEEKEITRLIFSHSVFSLHFHPPFPVTRKSCIESRLLHDESWEKANK